MNEQRLDRCVLFDWGDTLMRVFPEFEGPMVSWPRVESIPDAKEVLAELRNRFVLALATNAEDSPEADIRGALDRVGLKKLLDRVYCYRGIGHRKPSKGFYEYILADLGMDVSRVVMVGDDFAADVMGANGCGIRGIWFNRRTGERHEGSMYRTIHDLRALPRVLDSF